jgi:hypothetical protein
LKEIARIWPGLGWIWMDLGQDWKIGGLKAGGGAARPALPGGAGLDDHDRLGYALLVGDGQVDERLGSRRQDRP